MNDSPQERALEKLLELVGDADAAGTPFDEARARALAMQWPSLAAALANLATAHGVRASRPLRIAAMTLRQETVADLPAQFGGDSGSWCYCKRRPYRHLHDGTMPGNPVIK